MSVVSRTVGVVVLLGAGLVTGACSTMGLRGSTQSVGGLDAPRYDGPSYSGSGYDSADAAEARRIPDIQGDGRRYGRGYGYEPPPLSVPSRQAYATPRQELYSGSRQALDAERTVSSPLVRYYEPKYERRAGPEQPSAQPTTGRAAHPTPAWDTRLHQAETAARLRPSPPEQTSTRPPNYVRSGTARWMGASWKHHTTTSGEMFDPERLTAAHDSLPLRSFLYITNRENGRTVLVRVNDRVPSSPNRVVIVSQLAAELLGFRETGRAEVDLQYAGPAALDPNAKHEDAFLRSQPWFHRGLLHGKLEVRAPGGERRADQPARYPKPGYPRWDNTQR